MAKCSTDYPLGLLFKDENKTSDLVDTLRHLQKEYVPKGPDGVSTVLVGGDRLTEGNCRNIQWAFSDGATKEDRLEGLIFKFEDWHAIRNLFEIYHRIFYDGASSKDHGTLLANMTKLRCSNAKQGPHAAYNAYKEFVHKDTTALFLAAAMEHFGLEDVTENPDGFVPVDVNYGLPELKRSWLHECVGQVVDTFVMMTGVTEAASQRQPSTQQRQRQQFPCRADGCGNVYMYVKARETHERKKHNLVAPLDSSPEHASPADQDHQKQHTEARLGFGFFLLNMQDAVMKPPLESVHIWGLAPHNLQVHKNKQNGSGCSTDVLDLQM
ncbi:unnamed protein product [Pleuronectes platessa]|uniref:C2H2-type domain-containing protein n=1 Tax=Pleuronectes platessa TaxID=8262 RepID=A0A9N7UKH8_PLEPL|nr:unnamed protein product [Pleuronectes platessa]